MSGVLVKLLIFLVFAVVTMLSKRAKQARGDEAGRRAPQPGGPPVEQSDSEERERRIQEEIRRKIEERSRAAGSALPRSQPLPEPPQLPARAQAELATRLARAREREAAGIAQARDREAAQTRARADGELAQLQRTREARAERQSALETADDPAVSNGWIQELRDPPQARRAFVMREILGPPVSLR